MPKHRDRRHNTVQRQKEPCPKGVGKEPVSPRQAASPGCNPAFGPFPNETGSLPITVNRHL